MRLLLVFSLLILTAGVPAQAQHSAAEAYAQFYRLARVFNGDVPFTCKSITEIKYKSNTTRPLRDTSQVIYRDHRTYYRSRRVEHVDGNEGELLVNHELKTVSFFLSDSVKKQLQQFLHVKPDPGAAAVLETEEAVNKADLTVFKKFLMEDCNVSWESKEGNEEIRFTPKVPAQATLLSVTINFREDRIRYYEYTYRDIYANDYYGNSRFRTIRNIYQGFSYDDVPPIPARLSDFLQWNGWTVKLKKYPKYDFSVL